MERTFDALAEPVRGAWCELWPVLTELETARDPMHVIRFPAHTLARALQAVVSLETQDHEDARDHGIVESIHRRRIDPDETVALRWLHRG
jgi:hypothetical protein